MKHVYLLQMLEWYIGLETAWSVPVGSLGKGTKQRLLPELWAELEQCFAGADIAANWGALFHTVAVFRRVATMLGEHLGFTYPDALDRRVLAYAEQIRQMP